MGEIGIHLDHELGAAAQRAGEAGQVSVAEAVLGLTVEHLERACELLGQTVGDRAGAVGGVVIDDEDGVVAGGAALQLGQSRPHDGLDVVRLVVGGDDDPYRRLHGPRSVESDSKSGCARTVRVASRLVSA